MWRNLSPQERMYWDQQAKLEKERYSREKETYTGSWQVPHKRVKKVTSNMFILLNETREIIDLFPPNK